MQTKQHFVVQGLGGQRTLAGTVSINGAKNAALKAMAASVLFDGPVTLENIPDSSDVRTLSAILAKLGAKVARTATHTLVIDPAGVSSSDIDQTLAQSMRASVVLTGPLLGRFGRASFPAPGGCVIGARPVDMFVSGYEKMGAPTIERDGAYYIEAHASAVGGESGSMSGVRGADIFFNIQTVGGTETLMMAAVLASGTTILRNCALEPEIVNVAEWLNACGADIRGIGTTTLTIQGRAGKLLSPKVPFITIPDRIEAGSFLFLAALCGKDVLIDQCRPDHMEAAINLLRGSGVQLNVGISSIRVTAPVGVGSSSMLKLKSFNIRTHEYPGFPTDIQAPAVAFLTQATGESIVFETIFEGRFKYCADLTNMGANITVMNPREILIKGPAPLRAASDGDELTAHDIRAGFAVVMAAIAAQGTSTITNIHLIDRGYENIEGRLRALGVKIERV